MANGKKQVELENDSTTENTAIENNTGAENTAAPAEENIKIIVLSPFFDSKRHEIGEVLEVSKEYFEELKEKNLVVEREE
nr:MAG TPA: hypothetical protein [Caudoviricetes sp.]